MSKPGAFQKGPDPRRNAGGRPQIAKILEALGKTTDSARLELVKTAWAWMEDPKASDRSRIYAHTFLTNMVGLTIKQQLEVSGAVSEEMIALVEALKLTPIERRALEAQDATLSAE